MAASTTTTITTTSTGKPKHRCHREITISSSASSNTDGDSPHHLLTLSPQPQPTMPPSFSSSPYPYSYPSTFAHFNSALSAGLLSPITMSPPPHSRPTPTLLDMISSETPSNDAVASSSTFKSPPRSLVLEIQGLMHQRVSATLGNQTPGSQFNDPNSSDMTVILTSIDGFSVNISVHRPILVAHSRFFAAKLKQLKGNGSVGELTVEITDCEDVGVYVETLKLMYCRDLRKKLIKEDVPKVLSILKVSAAIGFDAGVLSCLEYLEAAPWSEDEEVEVSSLLSELDLQGACASEVLQRVSLDTTAVTEHSNENEEVFQKLLRVVLEGKDKKARRDMKGLVSKMLRESTHQNNFPKQSLYSACEGCLQKLHHHFLRAASSDLQNVGQIARQADNLRWILDILIDNQIADGFLKKWASLSELSEAHSKVPPVHRFEVSMVTSRLFVGIGKGQILASKDVRCLLLQTWLVPFYDDFRWMRSASKELDRHSIENGLSNTILTLPLPWQQDIFLAWFDRFLNSGEDCPNIQRGFEVWWRRAFWRRKGHDQDHPYVRIVNVSSEDS